jgi:hypothetical protein
VAQTSFDIDAKSEIAIKELMQVYGVKSQAAVLRRALAIAYIASKEGDEFNNLHLMKKVNGKMKHIMIPQNL